MIYSALCSTLIQYKVPLLKKKKIPFAFPLVDFNGSTHNDQRSIIAHKRILLQLQYKYTRTHPWHRAQRNVDL